MRSARFKVTLLNRPVLEEFVPKRPATCRCAGCWNVRLPGLAWELLGFISGFDKTTYLAWTSLDSVHSFSLFALALSLMWEIWNPSRRTDSDYIGDFRTYWAEYLISALSSDNFPLLQHWNVCDMRATLDGRSSINFFISIVSLLELFSSELCICEFV